MKAGDEQLADSGIERPTMPTLLSCTQSLRGDGLDHVVAIEDLQGFEVSHRRHRSSPCRAR